MLMRLAFEARVRVLSRDELQLYIVKKVRFERSASGWRKPTAIDKRALGRGFDPRLGHYARVTQWSE